MSDPDRRRPPRLPWHLPVAAALLAAPLCALPLRAQSGAADANVVVPPSHFEGLEFRPVGPARGGRVTTVAGHPDRPHTFYMGSTGGGVWKTTDYGHTWRNVSDGAFASPSMGAIRVAGSDPDVVYAGTGSDGIRSNVISGRGAYRSTDGGETWAYLGLEEAGQIGAIEVHPDDPDRAWLAALGHPFGKNEQRGVFRTTDGGDTWEKVLFVSDSVGAIDLELSPDDPSELYAAMWRGERKPWTIISGCGPGCGDGIYKSTDGGDTWRELEDGLPRGLIGKIDLAVTPADPDRLYALVEAPEGEEGLYRSDDRGESWRLVNDRGGLMSRPFYFTNVDAHPVDPDVVYVGNVLFYRSEDGGESFERMATPHADNHDLWINPDRPGIMIQSNDGGAAVSLNGGESWTTQYNQPTAELYQVDVDGRFPYWLYAGQQDNSTIAVPSLPPAESAPEGPRGWWHAVGGCETGPAVPRPDVPEVVYANCKGRFGRYSRRTGQEKNYWVGAQYMYGRNPAELEQRFQRTVPIEISPHDPDVVYHASQYVHRTTDGGATWERISPDLTAFPPERQMRSGGPITNDITGEEHFSTLYVVEESPLEEGVIWAGSNDGPVHVTRDGGQSWTDVTPEGLPPEARVNAIQPSPHRAGVAYVAAYRDLLDDWSPYVFRTDDHGESWELLTDGENGIPADMPVRVVREDPERPGLLYAGAEFGLYVSFDDGEHWQGFRQGLPVTPVTDIELHRGDLVVSTMGRGFWILDDLAPLRQLHRRLEGRGDGAAGGGVAARRLYDAPHLFAPPAAHRMRYDATPGGWGRAPHEPVYPEPGAHLDYYLPPGFAGELTLEVLGPDGAVIRTFRGEAGDGGVGDPEGSSGDDALPTEPGMHRFRWDLRHPGPREDGGGGPLAVPGAYRVRLTAGGRTETRELSVRIDPRVAADGVTPGDLRAQLRLNLRIVAALRGARDAADAIEGLRDELAEAREAGEVAGSRAGRLDRRLAELRGRLVTREAGSYPPPMLLDQLGYLYGMTTGADQRPGRDALERFRELRDRLDRILAGLEEVRGEMP